MRLKETCSASEPRTMSTPTSNQGHDMKKHPHHTLLPIHLQNALMSAATSGRMEFLDRTIKDVYDAIPQKFHTEKTVSDRSI